MLQPSFVFGKIEEVRKKSSQKWRKQKLYEKCVQDPATEISFLRRQFKKHRGRWPVSLREDFCFTGFVCYEWVRQGAKNQAVGIDVNPQVIAIGKEFHEQRLTPDQRRRIHFLSKNVVACHDVHADLVVAMNFSYWFFHTRKDLLRYFRSVRRAVGKRGMFVMDTTGGSDAMVFGKESERMRGVTYFWECESYNPITGRCFFSMHFKPDGAPLIKRAFTYDWRYWSIPETLDILAEAGFSKTFVLWEGENRRGFGNGVFRATENAEESSAWMAYIIALP